MHQHFGCSLKEVIEFIASQREDQEKLLDMHASDDDPVSQRNNEVLSRIVIPKFKAAENFLKEQFCDGGDQLLMMITSMRQIQMSGPKKGYLKQFMIH